MLAALCMLAVMCHGSQNTGQSSSSTDWDDNVNFYKESIGRAAIVAKLDTRRCTTHFIVFDLTDDYHRNNIGGYLKEQCSKRGLSSPRNKRVIPVAALAAFIAGTTSGLVFGASSTVVAYHFFTKADIQHLKDMVELLEKRLSAIQTEAAVLKMELEMEKKKISVGLIKEGIRGLFDGSVESELLEDFIPKEMFDGEPIEKAHGTYHVSVTSCAENNVTFRICFDSEVREDGQLFQAWISAYESISADVLFNSSA